MLNKLIKKIEKFDNDDTMFRIRKLWDRFDRDLKNLYFNKDPHILNIVLRFYEQEENTFEYVHVNLSTI
jgi:hypothetical protein